MVEILAMGEAPDVLAGSAVARSLQVRSFPTRTAMGRAAASDIAAAIRAGIDRKGGARIVFAAAPSQADMLHALAAAPCIDWRRVEAFQLDDYIGLPEHSPQSFANWLRAHFFDRVPIGAVHLLVPEPDPEAAADRYAAELRAAPIDIACLGIGVNGHLAFNDPPVADFADPLDVKVVELDAICRQQQLDDGCFDSIEEVPRRALTLTIPRLMRADRLFCVVPGASKRDAVARTLNGPIDESCPASILRWHADCTLYLDADSDPNG
jgi:glucosamine-6-phosphate deaminase